MSYELDENLISNILEFGVVQLKLGPAEFGVVQLLAAILSDMQKGPVGTNFMIPLIE
jgi:hypothetical protein